MKTSAIPFAATSSSQSQNNISKATSSQKDERVTAPDGQLVQTSLPVFPADNASAARVRLTLSTAALKSTPISTVRIQQQMDDAKKHLARYSELHWLADAGVEATNEGLDPKQPKAGSYSRSLGQAGFFPEFERSLQSLHCLNLIVDGSTESYQEFIDQQAEPKLSLPHFQGLSTRWNTLAQQHPNLNVDELLHAAQVALVLGDMGKSPLARQEMAKADIGITDPDHDDFYAKVIANPEACKRLPSFCRLNPEQQKLLQGSAGLAHFGHITHCEGSPEMYGDLKRSGVLASNPLTFDFAMLIQICDVAGALAQKNNQGSLTYNDETFLAIEDTIAACEQLVSGDELAAYNHLLAARSERLGLSPDSESNRILARLGAMLRLFTPEQGAALSDGFSKLNQNERQQAIKYLSPEGASRFPRTPTYMPAVLVNLRNNTNLGATPHQRLAEAIRIGIPFITETLKKYEGMLTDQKIDRDTPINFNPVAGTAATAPLSLLDKRVSINPSTGAVNVINGKDGG